VKHSNKTIHKILIVSPAFKKIGGKATFARYFVTYLKSRPEYEVTHLENTRSSRKRSNVHPTLGYKAIWNNNLTRLAEMAFMVIMLKFKFIIKILKNKPDVIFLLTSSYLDFLDNSIFIHLAKLFRQKLILRIGGGGFEYFYQNSGRMMKKYIRKVIKKSDKLICQSEYWKNYFSGNNFKEANNIHILPNLIDCSLWPLRRDSVPGNNTGELNILFIPGYQADIKGFNDLLPVFSGLVAVYNIRLIIVGLHHKLNGEYLAFQSSGKIELIQEINGESKYELFMKSDIYVLPSYMEGFPNTLLEAMASGLPILTTNIPSIRAIVNDRENALLTEPGNRDQLKNALTELINNSELRGKMSKNNRKKCEQLYDVSHFPDYLAEILN
jgi:glycosyltransferase involved in cell wall biosynthesis